ncbi:NPCBM-associated, NEW3 domain of alpha-galactosidase [Novipirellula galeiformis]|uniref:NPCBM-associated, NEW3 domain of alpha-galactosidase n=1 Tax=Novipirellula galeiformis TaxID=2528004 RepID=A0A5C6C0U0_9BACT|nr:DUF11 domain-containing protein [Novipirellula galeiformis]TWU17126.1 NPCBM-associated, NEW3 domain of alpha-galactosidase [Novipirellula galeiformis]
MNHTQSRSEQPRRRNLPLGRVLFVSALLIFAVASGCSRLRLPAVDPTGSCLFAPLPTTTTLALPGSGGESCLCFNCLRGLGSCIKNPKFVFPTPAFPEPATPPACPPSAAPAAPAGPIAGGLCKGDGTCVPSSPCNGSCQTGPPAVLFGDEITNTRPHCLPDRGKRGCILLSPQKIVAPVGGEVILMSGICGTDGYLQMNETLEWMLTPDSVGTFIQVGDDDPGLMHRLAVKKPRPEKHDPSYARGLTSSKRMLITRGNLDRKDDVQLEKGQTWISISSPSEGTSRVTVLAPESECWDQRKATATIYWIDARWQFPGSQIVPAGTPVSLTTRVTRAEGSLPARGWKVRYEVQQPEIATFAGTNGSSVVEAIVDENGNANAELLPVAGTSGTVTVDMQVIRPGGDSDNMPTMTLGRGQTFVTWSSPQLAIRAGAPSLASFDVPYEVVANVSNPGDQPANNVRVSIEFPPGTRAVSADTFAQVLPNGVVWEIGTIPPKTQLDLFMNVTSQSPVQMTFQARGEAGLFAEDTVRVDVFRPSLAITAQAERERYEAGQEVTFNIDVKNTGDRPLTNVKLKAFGDSYMVHPERRTRELVNELTDGPLQPGETWPTTITFIPTESGRRCVQFEATSDGGQRAVSESCVTVINPVPAAPTLTASVESRDRIATGESFFIRTYLNNSGSTPIQDTRVTLEYDPQLQLLQATEGASEPRAGQNLIQWDVPTIQPGQRAVLEGQFRAMATNPQSRVRVSAVSRDGTSADAEHVFAIVAGAPPATVPSGPIAPPLPPATPAPSIPGGPGQLPPSPDSGPVAPPLPSGSAKSDRVQVEIFGRDNPVRVGEPIRYTLRVTNDSDQNDGEVSVRFNLPPGVTVERVTQRLSPTGGEFEVSAGAIYLADIRSMRPNETVEYDIVMNSNQPQTFELNVESVSRRGPGGTDSVQTEVIQ